MLQDLFETLFDEIFSPVNVDHSASEETNGNFLKLLFEKLEIHFERENMMQFNVTHWFIFCFE